ncbi:MAG: hypothetical protein V3V20_00470 [Algisphaera sp.]
MDDAGRDLPLDERNVAVPAQREVLLETAIDCPNCGYNLTGVRLGAACPECNLIIGRGTLGGAVKPTSGFALASMILGICSITIGCGTYGLLSIVLGPLALIFWAKAGPAIREGSVSQGSGGMRTAGFVTGLIGTLVGAVGVVLIAIVVVMAFSAP